MATEPTPTSKRPVSQDNGGLWMDAGSNSAEDTGMSKDTSSLTSRGERTQEDREEVLPPPPTPPTPPLDTTGNPGWIEDDVFVFPPPCTVPSWPAAGSTSARKEPNIKVPDGADSVTDANANENPKSLDGEHGERHSNTAQDKVTGTGREEQVTESKMEGSMDITVSVTGETEENKTVGASSPVESHANIKASAETSQKEGDEATKIGKEEELTELTGGSLDDKVASEETNSPPTTPTDENKSVRSSSQAQPPSNMETTNSANQTDSSPSQKRKCGPPELCKCNLTAEETIEEPETTKGEEASDVDVEEKVDHSSVDYGVTKKQWVRRESACSEDPQPHPSPSRGSPKDQVTEPWSASEQHCVQVESGSLTVAKDIQQGEQLLHRLHLVQQRQDVQQVSVEPPPSYQAVMGTANQASGGSHEVERVECKGEEEESEGEGGSEKAGKERKRQGECRLEYTEEEEREKTGQEEREASGREESEAERGVRSEDVRSSLPVQPSAPVVVVGMDSDGSDDDSGVSADSNETPIERKIRRAAEMERNMRRFRGTPNSQENQDVVEIPFKTPVTLLSRPQPSSKAGPGQGADWQFSEKKMQKEISQEIQRELVLVNLGKIPGVYSKGTVRQLRERKMLFEAFQQGVTEGPTRHRRPISATSGTGVRRHVYPSVLERTRSLEMLSMKNCPLSRAHSLKLLNAKASGKDICSEDNPSSETRLVGEGAKRKVIILEKDVTLVAPYPSREKYLRLYKSMDSLNLESMAPIEKAFEEVSGGEAAGDEDGGSAVLRENPFFKLRPSLTLEKDIREAREREEELRRQRCSVYGDAEAAGEMHTSTEDPDSPDLPRKHTPSSATPLTTEGTRRQSKGKLDRIWPPPPPKGARAQETKVYKAGGQKAPLWQRWEAGMVNGKQPTEKD